MFCAKKENCICEMMNKPVTPREGAIAASTMGMLGCMVVRLLTDDDDFDAMFIGAFCAGLIVWGVITILTAIDKLASVCACEEAVCEEDAPEEAAAADA